MYVDIWRRRSIGTSWHWMVSSIVESLGTRLLIIHVLLTCDLFPLCPPPPSSVCFSSVPPLTVEGILKFLPGVAWRRLEERLIPSGVLAEIERQHQSDDSHLRAVIECWLQGEGWDEEPSWRRIIWELDGTKETRATANAIRHFAEPLPGKSPPHILVQCISPASHQIVFIQTQGVCDHMYMYVRPLFPTTLFGFSCHCFKANTDAAPLQAQRKQNLTQCINDSIFVYTM